MDEMDHEEPNAIELPAGETVSISWMFSRMRARSSTAATSQATTPQECMATSSSTVESPPRSASEAHRGDRPANPQQGRV